MCNVYVLSFLLFQYNEIIRTERDADYMEEVNWQPTSAAMEIMTYQPTNRVTDHP